MNLTAQDEIAVYVEGVRQALADLPDALRDELLEDLPEHLAEVLAEGGGSLYERLGPPDVYAAELSASAGLAAGHSAPRGEQSRIAETAARHRARISGLLHRADVRVGPVLGYPRASEFLVLLRPAWWVFRGYLAAMAVAVMTHNDSEPLGLLPRVDGDDFSAVILLALGILGSIWLGRAGLPSRRWPRRLMRLGTASLVLFGVVGFFDVDSSARRDYYDHVDYSNQWSRYSNVRDVFVYDSGGRLLEGVKLYDQDGQAIQLGEPACYNESGEAVAVWGSGYPYCPAQAPYRADGSRADDSHAPPTALPTPEESPASPAPSLSTGSSTAPSAGASAPAAAPPVTATAETAPR